jgi:hypothetical protein
MDSNAGDVISSVPAEASTAHGVNDPETTGCGFYIVVKLFPSHSQLAEEASVICR